MALCHKWDVKNEFANVLQFFSLISDGLGSVVLYMAALARQRGAMINYVSGKSQVSPKWEP